MTTDRNGRDAALEHHLRNPGIMVPAIPVIATPLAEKSLFRLSSELKNLIRGDRIFRSGVRR
ncbi:MAG: hypothetical protein RIA64_09175 [Rhodospirillales bacterium]